MNFYDLFEASGNPESKKDHEQDVTIADPKAALALKAARNKYSYANSDLEAFVKMVQDEQEEEQSEIDDLEAETAKQEELIQRNIEALQKNQKTVEKLRATEKEALNTIEALRKENLAQNHELTKLRAAEKEYGAMADQYNEFSNRLKSEISAMQAALAGVETPKGAYQPSASSMPDAPQRRRADYVPSDDSVLSRRISAED
jgi:predicted RNase H-like nuclease (RuvC/YqgF family)